MRSEEREEGGEGDKTSLWLKEVKEGRGRRERRTKMEKEKKGRRKTEKGRLY